MESPTRVIFVRVTNMNKVTMQYITKSKIAANCYY